MLSALSRPGAVLVTANGVLPGADVQGEDPSAPRIMVVHMLNANDEASLVRDAWWCCSGDFSLLFGGVGHRTCRLCSQSWRKSTRTT